MGASGNALIKLPEDGPDAFELDTLSGYCMSSEVSVADEFPLRRIVWILESAANIRSSSSSVIVSSFAPYALCWANFERILLSRTLGARPAALKCALRSGKMRLVLNSWPVARAGRAGAG